MFIYGTNRAIGSTISTDKSFIITINTIFNGYTVFEMTTPFLFSFFLNSHNISRLSRNSTREKSTTASAHESNPDSFIVKVCTYQLGHRQLS